MSEEDQDRIILGYWLAMLAGFTAGLSLMLFAFWVTAVPSVPWPEFARTYWGLHLGVLLSAATLLGLYVRLWANR